MSDEAERLAILVLTPIIITVGAMLVKMLEVLVELLLVLATASFGGPAQILLVLWETTVAALGAAFDTIAPVVLLVGVVVASEIVRETIVARSGVGPGIALFVDPSEDEPARSETEQTIEDAVEDVRARYVAGEIDEIEMESQLSRALDPEFHELIARLKDVGGIDDELAEPVAIRFGSVDELRAASDGELQNVSGIGEQRAAAIRDEIGRATVASSVAVEDVAE